MGIGARIRKLLTRASGTLLASRLERHKIWDFGGGHDGMVSHVGAFLEHVCLNCGALLVKLWGVVCQIVGRVWSNCGALVKLWGR